MGRKKKYLVLRIWFENCWHLYGTVCSFTIALKISERTPTCNVKAYLIFFSHLEYCNTTGVCPNGSISATPLKKCICPACEILCNSKEKYAICVLRLIICFQLHLFFAELPEARYTQPELTSAGCEKLRISMIILQGFVSSRKYLEK